MGINGFFPLSPIVEIILFCPCGFLNRKPQTPQSISRSLGYFFLAGLPLADYFTIAEKAFFCARAYGLADRIFPLFSILSVQTLKWADISTMSARPFPPDNLEDFFH